MSQQIWVIETALCLAVLLASLAFVIVDRRRAMERAERNTQLLLNAIYALRCDLALTSALRSVPPPSSRRPLPSAPMIDDEDDSEKTLVKRDRTAAPR
jgi:hypothetical protein